MTDDPFDRIPRPARRIAGALGALALVAFAVAVGVATWNVLGSAADEVLRPADASPVAVGGSPRPDPSASPRPDGSPAPSSAAGPSASPDPGSSAAPSASSSPGPGPTATPRPERRPVNVDIEDHPAEMFVSEQRDTWCAAAAVQIALNVNGRRGRADTSRAYQTRIHDLQVALTTRRDSHNGGAGPLGMVGSLEELGGVNYQLRRYATRDEAVRGAAIAITESGHAAILLAWRGAHAWVMTGYKATADPTIFRNAKIRGAYILDPWYPRVSSIWGPSDRPGVFQDRSEMRRNYLPWRRPEGRYPGRDGRFLVLVPVS